MQHSNQTTDAYAASWQEQWPASVLACWQSEPLLQLQAFLEQEAAAGKQILPPLAQRFQALVSTPFAAVKVVILGQDPYPTPGHAHGLAFSVQPDVKPLPRSLQNIHKEMLSDLGIDNRHAGYLLPWAEQGVLLLNTVLSVEAGQAGSHQKRGWEIFTDTIIQALNARPEPLVFILWGAHAQKKTALINGKQHFIIQSAHPSPLSARNGFFGSRPFSRCNEWLEVQGLSPINWQLPTQP